jgi:hypothetical protein
MVSGRKIGTATWSIASEKYYMQHRQDYYKALEIGADYESIDLDKRIPFLLMLPNAVNANS